MNKLAISPCVPRRLAVFGWSPEAADALRGLLDVGSYEAVGIADPSGSALVRARQATGLPCHQQVYRFLRSAEYDTLLVDGVESGLAAGVAAARGATILQLTGNCDADTLAATVEAARTHRVPLILLRPDQHDAGTTDLFNLAVTETDEATAHGDPQPHYLEVTVEGPADLERLLGVAVAHAVSLGPHLHGLVRVTTWGSPTSVIRASIEETGGQIHLHVRHAPQSFTRITGETSTRAFELRTDDDSSTISYSTPAGGQVRYRPELRDHWTEEAARASRPGTDDVQRAAEEAALLSAIIRSAVSGDPQSTDCCRGPDLHLAKDAVRAAPRRGHLRLVVS